MQIQSEESRSQVLASLNSQRTELAFTLINRIKAINTLLLTQDHFIHTTVRVEMRELEKAQDALLQFGNCASIVEKAELLDRARSILTIPTTSVTD